ncbi:serine hydrolase [Larkinella soli]|uniref:serine hydrolase n=1 Tax=Larkinella soli TaxID=1770527 RepID=UPI000FFC0ADB|nr:serine hydrolase [Larkinella soli]
MRLFLLPVLLTAALCLPADAQKPIAPAPPPSPLSAKADALFAEWNKTGSPGAAVGVIHDGKLVYAKGFGEADLETGAPITPETIFHVASVSKQFTAYGIMLLAQQGKLSPDDDIRKYLPEVVPDFGKTITIRHLLHHTSGIRDQWNLLAMAGWQLDDVITKQHIFNLIRRQKELNFAPGSEFAYSNTGYTLLAEIVSRTGGKPFREWMQQNVFAPLGMDHTLFYDDHERIVKGRAYSFTRVPNPFMMQYKKSVLSYANAGATSLFTTVPDLAKWMTNFHKTTLGNPNTMGQLLEKGRLTKGDTLSYAAGIFHGIHKGLAHYGHNGADAGFRSFLCYFPKEDYGFIVLSNSAEFNPVQKAYQLADLYLEKSFKEEKKAPAPAPAVAAAYRIDPKRFDSYVGDYQLFPNFVLTFKRDGERYFMQATGQPQAEIFASSDSTFYLKVVDAKVTFHQPVDGKVTRMTLHQYGNLPGRRVEPFTISKEALKQVAGTYFSPELETFYRIRQQSDSLMLVHVHHGEVLLKPVEKDRFDLPWWFIQSIEVVRNGDQVVGLRMSSGRVRHLWLRRLPEDFSGEIPPIASK